MEKTHLIIIVSLLITIIIVIFAVLLILAGNIQGMLSPLIGEVAAAASAGAITLQDGLMVTMLYTSLIPSALGAPLSWGSSMLGLFNSNFGMSAFMGYYMLFEILAAL